MLSDKTQAKHWLPSKVNWEKTSTFNFGESSGFLTSSIRDLVLMCFLLFLNLFFYIIAEAQDVVASRFAKKSDMWIQLIYLNELTSAFSVVLFIQVHPNRDKWDCRNKRKMKVRSLQMAVKNLHFNLVRIDLFTLVYFELPVVTLFAPMMSSNDQISETVQCI